MAKKKAKVGRPKSPSSRRRGEYLAFRATPAQAKAVDEACVADGMTRSEWLRGVVARELRRR